MHRGSGGSAGVVAGEDGFRGGKAEKRVDDGKARDGSLIEARPATLAADLATSVGRERAPFKNDVRKLKELGLTESLDVGYRLSPRGRAFLARLARD